MWNCCPANLLQHLFWDPKPLVSLWLGHFSVLRVGMYWKSTRIVKSTGIMYITCSVPVLNSLRSCPGDNAGIKVLLFQFAHCYRSWTKPKDIGWRPPSSWVSAFKMYCCERWQGNSLWLIWFGWFQLEVIVVLISMDEFGGYRWAMHEIRYG